MVRRDNLPCLGALTALDDTASKRKGSQISPGAFYFSGLGASLLQFVSVISS